jgi:hypothetical protein
MSSLIPIHGSGKKDDKKQKGGGYDLTGGLIDIGGNSINSQRPSSNDFDLDIDDLLSDKPLSSKKKSNTSSSKSSSKEKKDKSKSKSSSSPKKKSKNSSSSSSKKKKTWTLKLQMIV